MNTISPDIFPFIYFLTVRRENTEVVDSIEETGSKTEEKSGDHQPMNPLLSKLTYSPFL